MLGGNKTLFDEIFKLYGQRVTDALSGLVNNEHFVQSVQLLLERSLAFRDLLQTSLKAAFEQMNIPTRQDTDELKRHLRDVEDRLFAVEEILERLERRQEQASARAAKPAKPAAKSAKTKGAAKP